MDRKVYNWERYWVSREGAFSFDYDGFLLPPSDDTRWRSTQRTGVLKFEDIAPKPCLVLLGEPGIGKTFAVNAQVAQRSSLHLNLGSYGAEQRLIDDSFGSAPFKAWAGGGGELHIFFDSFDECLLRLDNVAALITDEVRRLKNRRGAFSFASRLERLSGAPLWRSRFAKSGEMIKSGLMSLRLSHAIRFVALPNSKE